MCSAMNQIVSGRRSLHIPSQPIERQQRLTSASCNRPALWCACSLFKPQDLGGASLFRTFATREFPAARLSTHIIVLSEIGCAEWEELDVETER